MFIGFCAIHSLKIVCSETFRHPVRIKVQQSAAFSIKNWCALHKKCWLPDIILYLMAHFLTLLKWVKNIVCLHKVAHKANITSLSDSVLLFLHNISWAAKTMATNLFNWNWNFSMKIGFAGRAEENIKMAAAAAIFHA